MLKKECQQQYRALRAQALHFLISEAWLIGEARDQGLAPSRQVIKKRLARRKRTLLAAGATIADGEVKIEAELAAVSLRARFAGSPAISREQITRYYRGHLRRFERAEVRQFDIVENLQTETVARAAIRKIGSSSTRAGLPLHESLERPADIASLGAKKAIVQAVFAAEPHVLSAPTPLHGRYSVFEVTRITPGVRTPLSRVEGSIKRTLSAQRQRQALAGFVAAWRRRWSQDRL